MQTVYTGFTYRKCGCADADGEYGFNVENWVLEKVDPKLEVVDKETEDRR